MSSAPPARDAELEAFVAAIEAELRARRGREHVLSPRDFALARGWHEAVVSLASVLVAIDAAFERDPQTVGLAPCRHRVEELSAGGGRKGAAPLESERASLPEVAERLAALRERLGELPGRAIALPLAELAEVSDLVAVASPTPASRSRPTRPGSATARWAAGCWSGLRTGCPTSCRGGP